MNNGSEKQDVEKCKSGSDLQIHSLIPCVVCSDGKLRAISLGKNQASKIKGFIQHIQGGTIKVHTLAMHLIDEKDALQLAADRDELAKIKSEAANAAHPAQWALRTLVNFVRGLFSTPQLLNGSTATPEASA